MAITINDIKLNSQDAIQKGVVEEFQKSSFVLNSIPFANTVVPGGGNSLTYSYLRTTQEAPAAFRAYGVDYNVGEAKKEKVSVELTTLGSKFQLDRLYVGSSSIVDELTFQLQQAAKSTAVAWENAFINGSVASDANAFNGLNTLLAGNATQEIGATTSIDLSTAASVKANAEIVVEAIDTAIAALNGAPSVILCNLKGKLKLQAAARVLGYYSQSEDAFGRAVGMYGNTPIVDMGAGLQTTSPIIPVVDTRKPDGTNVVTGLTDIYVVRFDANNGVHGVSLASGNLISQYTPNFNADGEAIKSGAVEMVSAIAVKSTGACSVLRNVKVQ